MSSFDINMFIRLQDNNYTPDQTTWVLMLTSVLIISMLGIFLHVLLSSADFFQRTFSKHSFRNSIRMTNGLDPDQDRRSVGPDLGPNCLKRLLTDDKTRR